VVPVVLVVPPMAALPTVVPLLVVPVPVVPLVVVPVPLVVVRVPLVPLLVALVPVLGPRGPEPADFIRTITLSLGMKFSREGRPRPSLPIWRVAE
jgi:hypothetical protein